ncbi:MAG: gluconate 2-dehydrogenase subunit 3 family protein [Gemmatimonadetes bacterium]|nr:gluconate 2-dehydrogenase subunit 3 family protein [Gemmatimonadota bacterium]
MSDSRWTMTRRQMIGATAAALVLPLLDSRPLAALTTRYNFAARVFSPAEFALVDELSDIIIPTDEVSPGARAARVAGEIDRMLADSLDPARVKAWHDGLRAVEDLSRQMNGTTFLKSTPEQRVAVVTKMASSEDETPGSRRRRRANPNTSIGGFYRTLKGATVRAYYTSSIGIHDDQHYKGNVYQQGDYAGIEPTDQLQ